MATVEMRHAAIKQICTLAGGLSGADGRRYETKPGTHQTDKMGRRDRTPGHPVGDVASIELPCDAPGREHQVSIPYLWIFEGASEEEFGFRPGTSCHQRKQVPEV